MVAVDGESGDREWLVEQRYRAVLEVLDGSPVSEVAVRYGVSRQSVYSWKARHAAAGVDGLREASRRPRTSPSRLAAEVEALVCELRRAHPRWGARRIAFEVAQRGAAARAVAGDGAPGPGPQRRWSRRRPAAQAQVQAVAAGDADGSCGSWTSSAGSTWPTAGSARCCPASMTTPGYVVIAAVLAVPVRAGGGRRVHRGDAALRGARQRC